MRVGPRELVLWSFLMASAHGAGLMLVPVLLALRGDGVSSVLAHAGHAGHLGHASSAPPDVLLPTLAAVGLHSGAMLLVAGALALLVYQKLGVEVLRRAWVNLDLIWVGALLVTGGMALALGLRPVLAG
jgi:cation transporter-like permease